MSHLSNTMKISEPETSTKQLNLLSGSSTKQQQAAKPGFLDMMAVSENQENILKMENIVDELKSVSFTNNQDIGTLKEQLAELTQSTKLNTGSLNSRVADVTKQVEKMQADQFDTYQKLWTTIEKNRTTLNEMIHIKVGEIEILKKRVNPAFEEIEKLKLVNATMQEQISNLEQLEIKLTSTNNQLKDLRAQFEAQQAVQPDAINPADIKNAERLIRELKATMTRRFEHLKAEMDAGFVRVDPAIV